MRGLTLGVCQCCRLSIVRVGAAVKTASVLPLVMCP